MAEKPLADIIAQKRAEIDEIGFGAWKTRTADQLAHFSAGYDTAVAEVEHALASPILGITLGPDLKGKISEQEALALVNASREFLLAGVRAMGSPKQQGGPDV